MKIILFILISVVSGFSYSQIDYSIGNAGEWKLMENGIHDRFYKHKRLNEDTVNSCRKNYVVIYNNTHEVIMLYKILSNGERSFSAQLNPDSTASACAQFLIDRDAVTNEMAFVGKETGHTHKISEFISKITTPGYQILIQ